MLHSGSIDSVNQSHNSIDSHDKPRAIHGFGLDMKIFHKDADGIREWYFKNEEELKNEIENENKNNKIEKDRWAEAALKVKNNVKFFYGKKS